MGATELRRMFGRAMADGGFTQDGGTAWVVDTPELRWTVRPDTPWPGGSIAIEIGCSVKRLVDGPLPLDPNECAITLSLELLPLDPGPATTFRSLVTATLHAASPVDNEERRADMDHIVAELSRFLESTQTEADLQARYSTGAFDSGFVRPDVAALLEAPRWEGDWAQRLRARLTVHGHGSALDLARAHPGIPLEELTALLGPDFAPIQLRQELRAAVTSPADARWLARDHLVRVLRTWFPHGWVMAGGDPEFHAAAALACWATDVAGLLPAGEIDAVSDRLWARRATLEGWRPEGPDDEILDDVFGASR